MTRFSLLGALALIGCTSYSGLDVGNYYNPASGWDALDDAYPGEGAVRIAFSGQFRGAIGQDRDVTGGDGSDGDETLVFTDDAGTLYCKVGWTTDVVALDPVDADCPNCTAAWDVACYGEHEAGGDCLDWYAIEPAGPPDTFRLAFVPDEPGGETGQVFSAEIGSVAWLPYAPATYRDGQLSYSDFYFY